MEISKIENIKFIDKISETKTDSLKRSIKLTNFSWKKWRENTLITLEVI